MATSNKFSLEKKIELLVEDGIDLENKLIYVWGELGENLGTILRMRVNAIRTYWTHEKKIDINEINIDISSYGGSIYSSFGAVDYFDELKRSKILINTKAQGLCMSAASILLCSGTGVRSASKRCKLMIHDIQTDGIGGTTSQVREYVKTLEKEREELFTFYVEAASRKNKKIDKDKELKKWLDRYANNSLDHYISSQEALELNLIDKII